MVKEEDEEERRGRGKEGMKRGAIDAVRRGIGERKRIRGRGYKEEERLLAPLLTPLLTTGLLLR